jgi:hypothetical protein
MPTDLARTIADAYRWQRRLGNALIAMPHCHIVSDPAHPDVWDSNHADDVTARTEPEIDAVFAAMDEHLGHTRWRVIHTDGFTPDAFLARLALDDFKERPVTIQMALQGDLTDRGAAIDLRPVAGDADWDALLLVLADHAEGPAHRRTRSVARIQCGRGRRLSRQERRLPFSSGDAGRRRRCLWRARHGSQRRRHDRGSVHTAIRPPSRHRDSHDHSPSPTACVPLAATPSSSARSPPSSQNISTRAWVSIR